MKHQFKVCVGFHGNLAFESQATQSLEGATALAYEFANGVSKATKCGVSNDDSDADAVAVYVFERVGRNEWETRLHLVCKA